MLNFFKRLRWFMAASLAFVMLPVMAAAADSRPDLVVAVNKLPRALEPVEKTGNVDVRVNYSIFDTLIRRDFLNPPKDGELPALIPSLATSWKRIDNKTLELKLRKGVKFHDGSEFTADDVVFTFSKERMSGKKAVFRKGRRYFGLLKTVKKIDDYTVQIITKKPDLMMEQRLATYASWIVSKKQWMKYKEKGEEWAAKRAAKAAKKKTKDTATGMAKDMMGMAQGMMGKAEPEKKKKKKKKKVTQTWMHYALKKIRWNPIGTGPLKFVDWKKNSFVKFTAHDDYFLGKPAFKSVTFKAVPELATRIAGLVAGDFQMIVDVPPDQFKVLQRYKDIDVRSIVIENTHMLVLTPTADKLKDKRLRQALSLAIDRAKLRKALWQDKNYTPNGHQLKTFGNMYNPKRKGYAYDPEKAKKLVKESGYDGSKISFRMIPNYYLNGVESAQILQEMWRKVGINVRLDMKDNFKQVRSKGVEIYAWSNTYRLPDPTGAIYILYSKSSSIQKKYKIWKAPKAFNKGLKKILTSGDPKVRYKTFQKVLDIFEDEMPVTMLYNPLYSYAVKKNIQWTPSPILYMDFRPDALKIKN
jgi:peptide/nickel transport system substrate-binding protein